MTKNKKILIYYLTLAIIFTTVFIFIEAQYDTSSYEQIQYDKDMEIRANRRALDIIIPD